MKVLIATTNLGKFGIYKQIFDELGMESICLRDVKVDLDVEETGVTEIENAVIKARAYHEITGLPVLCNDSGLIIDKLAPEDQPGVFVRRNNGKELTDQELLDFYVKKLNEVGGTSTGHFNVGLAIVDERGELHTREFKPLRFFASQASLKMTKGIPLDSIAYDKKTQKYMSEMTVKERNEYEGKELQKQKDFIREVFVR